MDLKDDKQFEMKEEEICQGHRVCYDFTVNNLSVKQTWLFKKTFKTDCKILQTSWLLEMLFQYLPDNGNISCYLTVNRNDTIDIPVKTFIWLRFSTVNDQPFFILPKILTSHRMLPNDEIKESIVEILPFPEVGTSHNQELVVAVVIRIRHCHSGSGQLKLPCTDT